MLISGSFRLRSLFRIRWRSTDDFLLFTRCVRAGGWFSIEELEWVGFVDVHTVAFFCLPRLWFSELLLLFRWSCLRPFFSVFFLFPLFFPICVPFISIGFFFKLSLYFLLRVVILLLLASSLIPGCTRNVIEDVLSFIFLFFLFWLLVWFCFRFHLNIYSQVTLYQLTGSLLTLKLSVSFCLKNHTRFLVCYPGLNKQIFNLKITYLNGRRNGPPTRTFIRFPLPLKSREI